MKRLVSIITAFIIAFSVISAFAEDFEAMEGIYSQMEITTEVFHSGQQSLKMSKDVCSATFSAPKGSKAAVCWFFDDITNKNVNTNALVSAGNGIIGVYGNVSTEKYVVKDTLDDTWYITNVARGGGWHQFVFDYSENGGKLYIDGKLVRNLRNTSGVDSLRVYDLLKNSNIAGMCVDDIEFFENAQDIKLESGGVAANNTDFEFDNIMCGSVALKIGADIAYVKNYKENIDVSPVIINNRTYVPVRFLTEAFGAQVKWDEYSKSVNIVYGSKDIRMTVGQEYMWVNNEKVSFDSAPLIIDGRTLVPVTAFCNACDMNVYWDSRGLVLITREDVKVPSDTSNLMNTINTLFDGVSKSEVMAQIYVSPAAAAGGDGTQEKPYKTVSEAKEAVKRLKLLGMTGDIEVLLMDGTYTDNITFTEEDSGFGHFKVIYKNAPNANPVIYGGSLVSEWEPYTDKIYKAHIGIDAFHTLAENSVSGVKARIPNEGYEKVAKNGTDTLLNYYYSEDFDMPHIENINDLEIFCWSGGGERAWESDTVKIVGLDTGKRFVEMNNRATYVMATGSRYYFQGALELIDIPGEFYYDSENGDLYYYPRSLPIEEQDIAIGNAHNMMEFIGKSPQEPVRNIKITGIELNTSDREYNGIYMKNSRNIEIDGVKILNMGGNGVCMTDYAYANRITGCEIGNVGSHGVALKNNEANTPSFTESGKFNEVTNCEIYSVGRIDGECYGVEVQTGYNLIRNNVIRDSKRLGIGIMQSTRRYILKNDRKTVEGVNMTEDNFRQVIHSQNNFIMFNDIYDVMNDSQDGGAIYSWGGDVNNVVGYNHIYDCLTPMSYGFGIYLDDAADYFIVKKNIVDNMYREGEQFKGATQASIFAKGIYNYMDNNFLASSPKNQYSIMTESMVGEPNYSLSFYRNISSNSGEYIYYNKAFANNRFENMENNWYYSKDNQYSVFLAGYTGPEIGDIYAWKNTYKDGAFDKFSEVGKEPGFYNEKNRDYRLKYNSETYKLGIEDIDEGDIGLTADYPYKKAEELKKLYVDTSDSRIYGSTVNVGIGESIKIKPYARTKTSGYIVDASASTYKIADGSIAAVDSAGNITGLKKGVTKLTIEFEGLKVEYDLIVGDSVKEVVLYGKPSESMQTGSSISTNYYLKTELGQTVKQNLTASYRSADESVATVTNDGVVTGVKQGETAIIAEVTDGINTYTGEMNIKVLDVVLKELSLKEGVYLSLTLDNKTSMMPEFELTYSDGTKGEADISKAQLSSSDPEVFTIGDDGTVTGHKKGKATLSVTYEQDGIIRYASIEVRVRPTGFKAGTFIYGSDYDEVYGAKTSKSMEDFITHYNPNQWALYKDIDFGNGGFSEIVPSIAVTAKYEGQPVQFRLDSPDGPIIGEVTAKSTGGWSNYKEQPAIVQNPGLLTGVHDVYMFYPASTVGNLIGFVFR